MATDPTLVTATIERKSFESKRRLKVVITMQNGTFSNGTNKLTVSGLRCLANIKNAGGMLAPEMLLDVYGLCEQDMNTLTTLYIDNIPKQGSQPVGTFEVIRNTIELYSGNSTLIFGGDIAQAWAIYNNAPDVFLRIEAITGYAAKNTYANPTSLEQEVSISSIVKSLADKLGLEFVDGGVNDVGKPYLVGSAIDQIKYLANAYNFNAIFEDSKITILPKRTARKTEEVPVINGESGLIGWPTFDKTGVQFICLFNPNIVFMGKIIIQSSNTRSNGTWLVTRLSWHLESEKPNGAWFMRVECAWRVND